MHLADSMDAALHATIGLSEEKDTIGRCVSIVYRYGKDALLAKVLQSTGKAYRRATKSERKRKGFPWANRNRWQAVLDLGVDGKQAGPVSLGDGNSDDCPYLRLARTLQKAGDAAAAAFLDKRNGPKDEPGDYVPTADESSLMGSPIHTCGPRQDDEKWADWAQRNGRNCPKCRADSLSVISADTLSREYARHVAANNHAGHLCQMANVGHADRISARQGGRKTGSLQLTDGASINGTAAIARHPEAYREIGFIVYGDDDTPASADVCDLAREESITPLRHPGIYRKRTHRKAGLEYKRNRQYR
jgi:hypothetical protein